MAKSLSALVMKGNPGFDDHRGTEIVLGPWRTYDIPLHKVSDPVRSELYVPILPELRIAVDIECDSPPNFSAATEEDQYSMVTFKPANPIFNEQTLGPCPPLWRFHVPYPKVTREHLSITLEDAIERTPEALRNTYHQQPHRKCLETAELIRKPTVHETITALASTISEDIFTEGRQNDRCDVETNLNLMVREWETTGKVVGTCKGISTMTTGVLHGLGLCARRLEGECYAERDEEEQRARIQRRIAESQRRMDFSRKANIPHFLENEKRTFKRLHKRLKEIVPGSTTWEGAGHHWTEVYIPPVWILHDASALFFGNYPMNKAMYIATVPFPFFQNTGNQKCRRTCRVSVYYLPFFGTGKDSQVPNQPAPTAQENLK